MKLFTLGKKCSFRPKTIFHTIMFELQLNLKFSYKKNVFLKKLFTILMCFSKSAIMQKIVDQHCCDAADTLGFNALRNKMRLQLVRNIVCSIIIKMLLCLQYCKMDVFEIHTKPPVCLSQGQLDSFSPCPKSALFVIKIQETPYLIWTLQQHFLCYVLSLRDTYDFTFALLVCPLVQFSEAVRPQPKNYSKVKLYFR